MSAEFLVKWNADAYGKVEPRVVDMQEFIDDGIEGDWGMDEDGEFTLEHLQNLELGDTHIVYDPSGWSVKFIRIKEDKQ